MEAEALESWRKAGRINSECRAWAAEAIKPGVTIQSVLEGIEERIYEKGAAPAFPAQSSRNHIAAHYCTGLDERQTYEVGDCVKVDLGVHVDGYIADSAVTVDLSDDGRWKNLIQASRDALNAAIALVEPGRKVSDIGGAIERTIVGAGFQPVRNLTGHGLARWKVHTGPQIPNYGERGRAVLKEGMFIAIEPFACTGEGMIRDEGRSEVFMLVRPPKKAKGLDKGVLAAITSWRGLPIARRYFREFDPVAVDATISALARQGSLMRYPPLVEKAGVMVAQTEHSLYLGPDGVEILTA